jgi:hypothetical protein
MFALVKILLPSYKGHILSGRHTLVRFVEFGVWGAELALEIKPMRKITSGTR